MVLGVLVSLLLFFLVWQIEEDEVLLELQTVADERSAALAVEAESLVDIMRGVSGLYAASTHVDTAEFSTYLTTAFPHQTEIRSAVWIEYVKQDGLQQFYQKAAGDGYQDLRLRELDADATLIHASPRASNYVVYHTFNRDQQAWFPRGLNLISLPAYEKILQQAIERKSLVSMRELNSIRRNNGKSIELFMPVYRQRQASSAATNDSKQLLGFFGMLIDVADSVESAYRRYVPKTGGLDVYIVDIDPRRDQELLYFHASRARSEAVESLPLQQLQQGRHVSTDVRFADSRWRVILRPIPGHYTVGQALEPWIALAGGLLFSLLVSGYINNMKHRRVTVEHQVREQTHQLDDSRKQNRAILDTVVDGIITIDAHGTVQTMNPAAETIFGYTAAEVSGRNVNMLMPEPYSHEHDGYLQNYLRTGERKVIGIGREVEGRRKDGSVFPMELAVSKMKFQGETMFTGIVRDITERKQGEQALRDSETEARKLAMVAAHTDNAVVITDADGYIEWVNKGFVRITGYSFDEVKGKTPGSILQGPDTDNATVKLMHEHLQRGEGFEIEIINYTKAGSPYWVQIGVRPIIDASGHLINFIAIESDISERKNAERALQDYASRLAVIQNTMVDGVITFDMKGIIDSVNSAAIELFGYTEAEFIGLSFAQLLTPTESSKYMSKLQTYLGTGEKTILGQRTETTGQRKDGVEMPLEFAVNEMWVGDERYFLANVHDISERKRLDRMKSEFISTVSHELRTPLTSIRGALGLVLGKAAGQIPDKMRNMLEMASRNSERLTILINDILDLEKIESGRMEFEFTVVDLVALTRRALEDNQGYADNHHVRLSLSTTLPEATVRGDEHRLLQVFANLISNAVKYSPEDGEVEISMTERNGNYRVSVQDHGAGIPAEFRARIFQRFAQADSSDTREKGGTGLGLSISKAIVEYHEGRIDYESEMGKGTVFYFDLPALQQRVMVAESAATGAEPRVLICEDNADVATILHEMLKSGGLHGDIANSVTAAREMLKNHAYRLLLLDLHLPDMDGLKFLQELRASPVTADLPVIVVSGRAEEGRMAFKGDAVTVVDWLQKPIDQERLERALHEALSNNSRARILHVEDDPDIVQVTKALFEDLADLSHVPSLGEARQLLENEDFDLVILDLGLADGSGVELLSELKGRCPVVIFSAQVASKEISAQVSAALTKSMTTNKQLLATIKNILGV